MSTAFTGFLLAIAVITAMIAPRWFGRVTEDGRELFRKLVHVVLALSAAVLPFLIGRDRLLAGTIIVLVALTAGRRWDWFSGIADRSRTMAGPTLGFAAFGLLLLVGASSVSIACAFVVFGLADSAGGLVGRRWGKVPIGDGTSRTWIGTIAVGSATCLAMLGMAPWWASDPGHAFGVASSTALLVAAVEACSASPTDNLLVPLSVAIWLYATSGWSDIGVAVHGGQILVTVVVAAFCAHRRWVTPRGALGLVAIGLSVFVGFGYVGVVLLMLFFGLSSILTKVFPERAVQADAETGRRLQQVLAFGAIPAALALVNALSPSPGYLIALTAAVAAACSDTFATEIGRFSRVSPRLVLAGPRVPPGTSGGVTPLGLGGALLGGAVISLSAAALGAVPGQTILPLALIGFAGATLDTLLGAFAQATYMCGRCGRLEETRQDHCGRPMMLWRGSILITNEIVNAIISAASATVAFFCLVI